MPRNIDTMSESDIIALATLYLQTNPSLLSAMAGFAKPYDIIDITSVKKESAGAAHSDVQTVCELNFELLENSALESKVVSVNMEKVRIFAKAHIAKAAEKVAAITAPAASPADIDSLFSRMRIQSSQGESTLSEYELQAATVYLRSGDYQTIQALFPDIKNEMLGSKDSSVKISATAEGEICLTVQSQYLTRAGGTPPKDSYKISLEQVREAAKLNEARVDRYRALCASAHR